MTDAADQLFERLGAVKDMPVLKRANGTMLFELKDGKRSERWRIIVDRGAIAVARGGADLGVGVVGAGFFKYTDN